MIGNTLSHFKITAKLGEGGFGVVYLAEDTNLHRPVALKVLSASGLARPDTRARFMREARTAAALNHPNICTIYEVDEVDGQPFIAMELIEGQGLDARLVAGEPLAVAEVTRIALRIARAMSAAHAAGIVHRDLKPANVMMTPDGGVKVLDFGLAKPLATLNDDDVSDQTITAEMTKSGTILGTVSYMSPEQAEGKVVDSRSDVFSFGILLYQMTTGELPFRGESSTSTLAKILEVDPLPLSVRREGLPADLERIVRRCLEKKPDNRYNDTRDLVAELHNLQTTGDTEAVTRRSRIRPLPIVIGIVVLVVAVLGVIFVTTRRPSTEVGAPATVSRTELPSIAVLPFHNLSTSQDNDYFSAGMTEEIISKLSRIDGLEVASRSSVASYTDPTRDVQQIGRDLDVLYLLDGSVRRAGDQVRVSAQLVDASSGRNVWSEDFDGSMDDIFAMQERTALTIAEHLDVRLSPEEQRGVEKRATDNVVAYDAYLRGMELARQWGSRAGLEAAIAQFQQAIDLDPDYAAAMAGRAFVECDMYRNFDNTPERIARAERLATRAAELDPTMADAHHALAMVAANYYDYSRASELLRETVQLAPKVARYWDNLSWSLAYETPPKGEESVRAALKALELQPHFPGAYYHLARAYIAVGKYDEAKDAFDRMVSQNPDFSARNIGFAQYYLAIGDYDEALVWIERDKARDTALVNWFKAAIYAAAGNSDEALKWLEVAFDKEFRDFVSLDSSEYFASLRDDPRYKALVDRYR
jgi:serine/threonine protein kinase/tetratricopeptide (TPR) repeat protein